MNRTLTNVLFGGIAAPTGPVREMEGTITKTNIDEVVEDLVGSSSVIIVPGYGMAVAKAQYAIAEMAKILQAKNVKVRFAVHPVAGKCIDQNSIAIEDSLWSMQVACLDSVTCF